MAALPAVGVLTARRLRGLPGWKARARRLRRTSLASAAACLGFFASHVCYTAPNAGPKVRAMGDLLGLAERVALGLELSLLYQLAGAVLASKEES